jgi:hypothetical protein
MMKSALALALLAAIASCGSVHAEPQCAIGDAEAEKAGGYIAAVKAAVAEAPDCDQAYAALEACQLGSSADNPLSDLVLAKCEPAFLPKASAATKMAYKKAQAVCNKIAETESGSMYQSFAAVCLARASRDFARKAVGVKAK